MNARFNIRTYRMAGATLMAVILLTILAAPLTPAYDSADGEEYQSYLSRLEEGSCSCHGAEKDEVLALQIVGPSEVNAGTVTMFTLKLEGRGDSPWGFAVEVDGSKVGDTHFTPGRGVGKDAYFDTIAHGEHITEGSVTFNWTAPEKSGRVLLNALAVMAGPDGEADGTPFGDGWTNASFEVSVKRSNDISFEVPVTNDGLVVAHNVTISAYYKLNTAGDNSTTEGLLIQTIILGHIAPGSTMYAFFTWNTTGLDPDTYRITFNGTVDEGTITDPTDMILTFTIGDEIKTSTTTESPFSAAFAVTLFIGMLFLVLAIFLSSRFSTTEVQKKKHK